MDQTYSLDLYTLVAILFGILVVGLIFGWIIAPGKRKSHSTSSAQQDHLSALVLMNHGEFAEAERHLQGAIALEPDNLDYYLSLADLHKAKGEDAATLKALRSLADSTPGKDPKYGRIIMLLAKEEADQGEFDVASEHLLHLLENPKYKNNLQAMVLLREVYIAAGNWEKAYHAAELALQNETEADKDRRPASYLLALMGSTYLAKGNKAEAATLIKKSQDFYKNCVLAKIITADLLLTDSKMAKAQSAYLDFIHEHPNLAHLVFDRLQKVFQSQGEAGNIMPVYEEVMVKNPSSYFTMLAMADHYAQGRDLESASEMLDQADEVIPNTLPVAHRRVEIYMANQDIVAVVDTYENLLKNLETYIYYCVVCSRMDEQMIWHCPSCSSWGTYRPREGTVEKKS